MREASYSTLRYPASKTLLEKLTSMCRMGGYDVIKDFLGATDPSHTPLWKVGQVTLSFLRPHQEQKIVSGAASGALGAAIANPTDLVKGK